MDGWGRRGGEETEGLAVTEGGEGEEGGGGGGGVGWWASGILTIRLQGWRPEELNGKRGDVCPFGWFNTRRATARNKR